MSTTAVPLRSIAKGSLTRLWVGVAAIALAAGGLTWAGVRQAPVTGAAFLAKHAQEKGVLTTPSGLQFEVLKEGTGPSPAADDVALVGYKGALLDGTIFDQNPQAPMEVNRVVPGFSEGLQMMKAGGSYRLWIPPQLGYGAEDNGPIPGNSVLVFDVDLHQFKSRAEIMKMQQMMQQQQGGAMPPQPMPGQ
jgi:FKBP-type peptidyl-prolyl cis-trans isomerase FkpA